MTSHVSIKDERTLASDLVVVASQRVRPEAAPDDRLREAIQKPWICFVATSSQ
jgi:hypothetical protein